MTARRSKGVIWLAAAAILAALAWALLARLPRIPAPRAEGSRPPLMLVTSLPLLFGESFSLESTGSTALKAVETRYRLLPIGVTSAAELGDGRLLLMAHPLAQPAESLVDLDSWVRRGGRVLILADPALRWPSSRPLGDRLRPPPSYADTGLLAHWGLRLDAPEERSATGQIVETGGIRTVAPGLLAVTGENCRLERGGLVARCRIGRGAATVIADADFLNVDAIPGGERANLPLLLDELERLER